MPADPIHDISQNAVLEYTDQVKRTNGVFSMIQESFQFTFTTFQGVVKNDLQTIACGVQDQDLKHLLSQAILAGSKGSKYSDHCIPGETGFKKVFLAFRMVDGKYDVVYCVATQIRTIDWRKIGAAMGIGAVIGVALLPVPGVNVAAVLLGAAIGAGIGGGSAYAVAEVQKRDISNILMGYIGKELSDRNLLRLV